MQKAQIINLWRWATLGYAAVIAFTCVTLNFIPKVSRDLSKDEENGTFLLLLQIGVTVWALLYAFSFLFMIIMNWTVKPASKFDIVVVSGQVILSVVFMIICFVCHGIQKDQDNFLLKLAVWFLMMTLDTLIAVSLLGLRLFVHRSAVPGGPMGGVVP